MVLADPERVQTSLIGPFDLIDQLSQTLLRRDAQTVFVERRRDAVDSNVHDAARSATGA